MEENKEENKEEKIEENNVENDIIELKKTIETQNWTTSNPFREKDFFTYPVRSWFER